MTLIGRVQEDRAVHGMKDHGATTLVRIVQVTSLAKEAPPVTTPRWKTRGNGPGESRRRSARWRSLSNNVDRSISTHATIQCRGLASSFQLPNVLIALATTMDALLKKHQSQTGMVSSPMCHAHFNSGSRRPMEPLR